jgi:hypothetical protein
MCSAVARHDIAADRWHFRLHHVEAAQSHRTKVSSDVNAEKITLAKEMKALLQERKYFVINHIRRKQNTQLLAR